MFKQKLKKYLLVQPKKDTIKFNSTIKYPLFGIGLKKYTVLDETYAYSLLKAEHHFGFFGWWIIGSWPHGNKQLSPEKRLEILELSNG